MHLIYCRDQVASGLRCDYKRNRGAPSAAVSRNSRCRAGRRRWRVFEDFLL